MKTVYTLFILMLATGSSNGQTYRIYTAQSNGNWNAGTTWNNITRTDGVTKNKYIIPVGYTVTATSSYDYTTPGDVEIIVNGTLNLASGTILNLTQNSNMQIIGSMKALGASAVTVGNSWKYLTFGVSNLTGPLFTDFATVGFATSMLPVRFISFTAADNANNNITLKWSTTEELNNSHFDIEYSLNGRDWLKAGTVTAQHNNAAVKNYFFIHSYVISNTVFYRLKQIDKDGKSEYSEVAVLKNTNGNRTEILSADKKIAIKFATQVKGNVLVRVVNMNGQVIFTQQYNNPGENILLPLSNAGTGNYVVQVAGTNNLPFVKTIFMN